MVVKRDFATRGTDCLIPLLVWSLIANELGLKYATVVTRKNLSEKVTKRIVTKVHKKDSNLTVI